MLKAIASHSASHRDQTRVLQLLQTYCDQLAPGLCLGRKSALNRAKPAIRNRAQAGKRHQAQNPCGGFGNLCNNH
jgi:hypothetical protein